MRTSAYPLTLLVLIFLSSFGLTSCGGDDNDDLNTPPTAEATITLLLMRVLQPPVPVAGSDQKVHLVYELELRNITQGNAVLASIEIFDADSGVVVATLDSTAISQRFQLGSNRDGLTTELGAAQFGVLYVHLTFADLNAVPLWLGHRIRGNLAAAPPDLQVAEGAITEVKFPPPIVLGPPLKGSNYIAADGCCDSTRHIRALLPINGDFQLAQRFAIDWEQLDDQNRIFVGDIADPNNYPIYGNEVLAVADATVAVAVDGFSEYAPGQLPANIPLEEADGNHVILALGDGIYVLYAHLIPGSVRVKVDDQVKRGQVLGLVGTSGNSSAPHLHLHVMDAPSGLTANGLPYVHDNYQITGIDLLGTADFDNAEATGDPVTITPINPASRHVQQLPMDLTLVDWLNSNE